MGAASCLSCPYGIRHARPQAQDMHTMLASPHTCCLVFAKHSSTASLDTPRCHAKTHASLGPSARAPLLLLLPLRHTIRQRRRQASHHRRPRIHCRRRRLRTRLQLRSPRLALTCSVTVRGGRPHRPTATGKRAGRARGLGHSTAAIAVSRTTVGIARGQGRRRGCGAAPAAEHLLVQGRRQQCGAVGGAVNVRDGHGAGRLCGRIRGSRGPRGLQLRRRCGRCGSTAALALAAKQAAQEPTQESAALLRWGGSSGSEGGESGSRWGGRYQRGRRWGARRRGVGHDRNHWRVGCCSCGGQDRGLAVAVAVGARGACVGGCGCKRTGRRLERGRRGALFRKGHGSAAVPAAAGWSTGGRRRRRGPAAAAGAPVDDAAAPRAVASVHAGGGCRAQRHHVVGGALLLQLGLRRDTARAPKPLDLVQPYNVLSRKKVTTHAYGLSYRVSLRQDASIQCWFAPALAQAVPAGPPPCPAPAAGRGCGPPVAPRSSGAAAGSESERPCVSRSSRYSREVTGSCMHLT